VRRCGNTDVLRQVPVLQAARAGGVPVAQDLLLDRMPSEPEPALVHGDCYSNNWVCSPDRLPAVVEGEIASIAA
jgi:aminoglycoside phosphotransferase (APT) family kinase protein